MHVGLVMANDDPTIRGRLGSALTGYTVFEAARGDDALALVRREQPGLILLGVEMPGRDGRYVEVRRVRPLPRIERGNAVSDRPGASRA